MILDDLSNNKVATLSPMYPGHRYYASYAVDRNSATCMMTDEIGRNYRQKTMWWKVDLGSVYSIYSIGILFKNYDGYGIYFVFR